ncbi:dihydroorotate dehydrogenase electron transfer subunit [Thermosediminibacter litoriperuensis]|uniref:Dihydroorotate dehydrogenase B (NAD(+)), electron transfer subunit n=1 Tax=Thermosediminibacter litoriperuensis TaxID=291989 RepID=A0A5S5AMS7_9FIRM|nr:dihydroorotate dehydrogenase electron transfer subunit [Thermosediminibacter litoriperuensis]TYP52482.1 dihydroorotate dehydrogenase electron transfer subunit [Thermosediminibacter litoriperuensis]
MERKGDILAGLLFSTKVIQNVLIAYDIYHMKICCPEVAEKAAPGQFLHIRCSDGPTPLLRRPISIAGANEKDGTVEMVYRVLGEGTRLISQKKAGEILDVMGPLGRGFPVPLDAVDPVLIGGGVGVAPLLYLAQKIAGPLSRSGRSGAAFIGFSTAGEVFGVDFLKSCGFTVFLTTDDGTAGQKGVPTEAFENCIKGHEVQKQFDIVYACGPKPFLAKVKDAAVRGKIPAYLSLEERMACGVGACLGCAVKSAGEGYKKVCRDGPVFEAGEIQL